MTRAIELATRGKGFVEPNPMVGCVLVKDGVCIGEGYHRRFGGPHAEVDALEKLAEHSLATGATAYVTLEPCCHTGKTPPCTDALIAAKLARVVVANRDPFPQVDGGGLRQLSGAGIEVVTGVESAAALDLNAPYFKRLRTGRPWVIAKWAMSVDGRIATATGDSQWISGELSRGEVHRLRGRVDAIIVGSGTVTADNPTLTARPPGPRSAIRVVFAGETLPALGGNLMRTLAQAPLLVVTAPDSDSDAIDALENHDAEIMRCQASCRIDRVREVLTKLATRGMTNVLVEGGANLLASFVAAGEVDEIHAFIAPKLIGGDSAPGPVGGSGFAKLIDAPEFELRDVSRWDNDIRLVLRKSSDSDRIGL